MKKRINSFIGVVMSVCMLITVLPVNSIETKADTNSIILDEEFTSEKECNNLDESINTNENLKITDNNSEDYETNVECNTSESEANNQEGITEVYGNNGKVSRVATSVSDTYKMGTLTNADGLNGIVIDGRSYDVTDDFDFNKAAMIWVESKSKKIVYKIANELVEDIYSVEDIMHIDVSVKPSETELVYRNGEFEKSQFNLNVELTGVMSAEYSFLPQSILNQLYITIKKVKINTDSEAANFGQDGLFMFKNDVKYIEFNVNQSIRCGEKTSYNNNTVYLNSKYKMTSVSSVLELQCEVETDDETINKKIQVSVGNLDYQEEKAEEKRNNSVFGKKVKAAQNENKEAEQAVSLDANIMKYLDANQMKEVYKFLYAWTASAFAATSIKFNSNEKKIKDEIYSNLGINQDVITRYSSMIASTNMDVTSTSGAKLRIHFSVNLGSYVLNEGTPYAGMGNINYEIYDKKSTEAICTGIGMVTYADIAGFVSKMKDIAESAVKDIYNNIWGYNANKIADYLTEGTVVEVLKEQGILKGTFSDHVYKLMTEPTKRYIKAGIHCPVDVYVYDSEGNLCGVVKNNVINTQYNQIYISVIGDEKYVYFPDDNYRLELKGNDIGIMSYTIEEYDSSGNKVRTMEYDNVTLTKNTVYNAAVLPAASMSSSLYDLTCSDGKEIRVTNDDVEKNEYNQSISYGLLDDGTLVVDGDGKAYLGDKWENRNKVKKIDFISGNMEIENQSFRDFDVLEVINIDANVETIGEVAFGYCDNLNAIILPKTLKEIRWRAFISDDKLEHVYFNGEIENWCNISFRDSHSNPMIHDGKLYIKGKLVTELIIPDSVECIGSYVFSGCTSLTDIVMSNNILSIGTGAFEYCSSLKKLNIPEKTTFIDSNAFYSCSNLETISFTKYLEKIGYGAFEYCSKVSSVYYWGNVEDWCKIIFADQYSNPMNGGYDNYFSPSVGANLYFNNFLVTNVTITKDIKEIPSFLFSGCGSLREVEIEEGISSIGEKSFADCVNLGKIQLPDSINDIGSYAFCNTALEYIIIPERITSINEGTFAKSTIKEITLPKELSNIENRAFLSCVGLESIIVPDNVTQIKSDTFYGCMNLKKVELGEKIISIGAEAFRDCDSLKTIKLPESLIKIGNGSFYDCDELEGVIIPQNVQEIGELSFSRCKKLSYVDIPKSLNKIADWSFSECYSLRKVDIEQGVECIGYGTFSYCKSLAYIVIPDTVSCIGVNAFYGMSDGLNSLNHVYFLGNEEQWKSIDIKQGNQNLTSSKIHYDMLGKEMFSIEEIEPKCNQDGKITYTCLICGETFADIVNYNRPEHSSTIKKIVEPTCIEEGYTEYECSICGEIYCDDYIGSTGHKGEIINVVKPTCTEKGYTEYKCSICGETYKSDYVDALGHNLVNGICKNCGKSEDECMESVHPYIDNCNEVWTINKPGAKSISITFSENTQVENDCDYICILDQNNNEVGCYTGDSLALRTIIVLGDTVKIKLVSDGSVSYYGFSLTSVKVNYNEPFQYNDFEYLILDDETIELIRYIGSDTKLIIPDNINGKEVTGIGYNAFYNCKNLEAIEIPTTIKYIGYNAFYGCSELEDVYYNGDSDYDLDELIDFDDGNDSLLYVTSIHYCHMKSVQETTASEKPNISETTTPKPTEKPTTQKTTMQKETTQNSSNMKKSFATKIKSVKKAKKSLKVTWKKVKGVTGYQIQYSTSSKFKKSKKITIKKAKTTSKTIKKLKAKKKYYVRIRTYITVNGKKKYSGWSKKKSQKTK